MRLLLIEDNIRLVELVSERVHDSGWRVDAFGSIRLAQEAIEQELHNLLVVDIGLPDGDGLELVRWVRRKGLVVPILILTSRGEVADRIAGLDAGADDYLTKPFDSAELLARCRALMRRNPVTIDPHLQLGGLHYDPATLQLTAFNRKIELTSKERAVIEILLRAKGQVVLRSRLETGLSEYDNGVSSNAIDLSISRLRRKLGNYRTGISVETVRGVGYLLRANEE